MNFYDVMERIMEWGDAVKMFFRDLFGWERRAENEKGSSTTIKRKAPEKTSVSKPRPMSTRRK